MPAGVTPLPRDWYVPGADDLLDINPDTATAPQVAAWAWAMYQVCRLQHPTMALSKPKPEQIDPTSPKSILGDLLDTHGIPDAVELIRVAADHHRAILADAAQHEPPKFRPALNAGFFKSLKVVSRAQQIIENERQESMLGPDTAAELWRKYA